MFPDLKPTPRGGELVTPGERQIAAMSEGGSEVIYSEIMAEKKWELNSTTSSTYPRQKLRISPSNSFSLMPSEETFKLMVKSEEDIYKLLSMDCSLLKIFCVETLSPNSIETLIIILLSLKRITALELILHNSAYFDSLTFDSFC